MQDFAKLKSGKLPKSTAEDVKETFIAMVSHDLKTPLHAEINALELLLTNQLGTLTQQQTEILCDILNSARFMKNMIENLLYRYKIETGEVILFKKKCAFKSVIQSSIEETKYILLEKKQSIIFECSVENSETEIDAIELKRVINNLIANASEHSPTNLQILIKLDKAGEYFQFSILNYGDEIKPSDCEDIFEKYISISSKNKRVGTGLGLYISKRIVEAHGGKISVFSSSLDGTILEFLIPIL